MSDAFEFNNKSGLEFTDISTEAYRLYHFPGGDIVRINYPTKLHVSASGGHRLWDIAGHSHYIPSGWLHLEWLAKVGSPNFVK